MKKKISITLIIFILGAIIFIIMHNERTLIFTGKADENGIFNVGEYYFKVMEPYQEPYMHGMSDKLNFIKDNILKEDMKAYYGIIPDKTYFVQNEYYPKNNYYEMVNILNEEVDNIQYIDLFNILELEDYYKTDHHWRQEKILKVANTLGKHMDFTVNKKEFKEKEYEAFKGVYSEYIENPKEEKLIYLTNELLDNAKVEVYGQEVRTGVYKEEVLNTETPYHLFISEPSPFVDITNSQSEEKRELIIFGDSFANSLIPLLLKSYSRITLIDLRLVSTLYLTELIEFEEQEVLFIYNTSVINRSAMLK